VSTEVDIACYSEIYSPNLVGIYGSDCSVQRRFPVAVACSNLEISAIKLQNGFVENYVFRPKNFWRKGPPKSDAVILCPYRDTSSRTVWCNFPNRSRRYQPKYTRFWQIFEFQALKNCWGRWPIPIDVCISKRWSSSTNCKIFRGQSLLAPEIWASEKVDWVGRKGGPIFRHVWTRDCSFQRRFPIDDILFRPEIKSRSPKFWRFLGRQIFWRGTPNFWLNFINYSHHRTYGKVWRRSAQRPPRLGDEKNKVSK